MGKDELVTAAAAQLPVVEVRETLVDAQGEILVAARGLLTTNNTAIAASSISPKQLEAGTGGRRLSRFS
jgi:hypothetical protein